MRILAFLVVISSFGLFGCPNIDNQTGIEVAIEDVTFDDGSEEGTLDIDAVQNPSCPTSGDPEEFTAAFANVSIWPRFITPENTTASQVVSYVKILGYTVTFTANNTDLAAEIPAETRVITMDVEMNSKPTLNLMLLSLEQKIQWQIAQLDIGDTIPKEYDVTIRLQAQDGAGRELIIKDITRSIQIGAFDNC